MNLFYQLLELFATFTEGLLVLSVSSSMSGKKYKTKTHNIFILLFSVIYTVLITYMNTLQIFSFATITVAVLYSFAVLFIISSGKLLLKASATMLTFFFIHSLDYTLSYSLIMIMGKTFILSEGVELILNYGIPRVIFLLLVKSLQIVVFVLFKKLYANLKKLDNKNIFSLFLLSTTSFILIQVLTRLIMTDSVITIQIVAVFSFLFVVLSLISVIAAIYINSKYQREKRESELMLLSNAMMEKSFTELQRSQNAIHQQVHDFKNHIRTINGMINSDIAAKKYIEDLLSISYAQAQHCHCGNDVINSIINCKAADAKAQNIPFKHRINLTTPLYISSIDICAILANQIDNALEACSKIPTIEYRFVRVEIWQKENFIFFKVTNATIENPFNRKHELVSTKTDNDGLHGFGIKNITRTVSSYGGTLRNVYKDGSFTSIAMVPNNE
jgi:hypothetical protein